MNVVLYPRAAPSDRLRVWIGVFQVTEAPAISWTINQQQTNPQALREIASVRPDDLLPADGFPTTVPRAFTGVYEFDGLQADTFYEITATVDGQASTLRTRTLPDEIPRDLDRWFNVLLVSCFHQAEDRGGLAGTVVSQLSSVAKPHLTFLAGDQVYLDLPTLRDFPDDAAWLARKFEEDYTLNWAGLAYTEVLQAAPSVSVPDDHEYWNNFPHHCAIINNTFLPDSRERWKQAARTVYEGFQLPYPNKTGDPVILDVHPLSFFLADTRSEKDPNLSQTMSPDSRKALDDWVTRVIAEGKFGVFLSGQSLFRTTAHRRLGLQIDFAVDDYELPDYGDFPEIVRSLKRLQDAGRPVLCLTGDVHWGRVATAQDIRTGRTGFAEIISSPASLVSSIGIDQKKQIVNVIGGWLGRKKEDWPRHLDADPVPTYFASEVLDGFFPCTQLHTQRGNHVVMLSFRQHAGGVELRIKYWPISLDRTVGRPIELKPIDLTNA